MAVAILVLLGAVWAALLATHFRAGRADDRGSPARWDGDRCAWHRWERRGGTLVCARCGFRAGEVDRPSESGPEL